MTTATPEQVSAILRDPDSPLMPDPIGVFCDDCGTVVEGQYIVSEEQTKEQRLEVARVHMRAAGWVCDENGDYCPDCQTGTPAPLPAPHGPRAARYIALQLAAAGEHSHLSTDGNTWCLSGICPADPVIDIAPLTQGPAR
jgi:hypothetical protein